MASRDSCLARINGGLKPLGCTAAIEVSPSGKRIRLRATLPTPEGVWKQLRISTDLRYPWGIEQARKLAEQLSKDAELHRMGLEPFPFDRWFEGASMCGDDEDQAVSGLEAVRRPERWWSQQRRRGESAAVSWATD